MAGAVSLAFMLPVLRFRDDCSAFDPVSNGRQNGEGMGIRLVMNMASEVHYTCSMNLNNLMLVFEDPREGRTSK